MKVENTIAYYDTAKINAVKSFIVYIEKMLNKVSLSRQASEGLFKELNYQQLIFSIIWRKNAIQNCTVKSRM